MEVLLFRQPIYRFILYNEDMVRHVTRQREIETKPKRHSLLKVAVSVVAVFVLAGATTYAIKNHTDTPIKPAHIVQQTKPAATAKTSTPTKTNSSNTTTTASTTDNPCADNTLSQLALVSISQRHMWACNGTTVAYDSAVVTGMENLPADLTPVGTYHIFAKETDVYLKGSDSTGSWDDFVNYWMPWLDNQYGEYGFHDATWRPSNAFGNISPYSSNASHGCVELPLATAKWLYGWAQIGTTVQIES
jgi:lipoprotein-anchoring transpeptidase ErfK/SrfK